MKAKNILRISLFAALLCMITILGAFAAEDTAKIFRFDGMGNVLLSTSNNGAVNSDGNFKINSKEKDLTSNINLKETNFTLSNYPYIKLKYRTDFPKDIQFYVTTVKNNNIVPTTELEKTFHIFTVLSKSTDWKTVEFSLVENDCTFTEESWRYIYKYNNGNGSLSYINGNKSEYFLPTAEKDIRIDSDHSPFFMLRNATDEQIGENGWFFELEYIAFFSTETEMKAYNGVEEADPAAKVIAWDGTQNIGFTTQTSPKTLSDESKMFSVDDGCLKIDMKVEYLNNSDFYEGTTGYVCFQPFFKIDEASQFNLYNYPYVKINMKTDYPETIQFYNPQTVSRVDFKDLIKNKHGETVTAEFDYKNKDAKYVTDGITWTFASYGSNDVKIDNLRFQFKGLQTGTNASGKEGTAATSDYSAEIYYIAYFDDEDAMLAYDPDTEKEDIKAVDNAVIKLLNPTTEYSLTIHPALYQEYREEIDIVNNYVCGLLEDVDVTYTVSVDADDITENSAKAFIEFRTVTYVKTIGINVKLNRLDDSIIPTVRGAQTRTDGTFGLRFGFIYNSKANLTGYDNDSVKYGVLLTSETLLDDDELTHEFGDADTVRDVERVYDLEKDEATGNVTYTAVVTDIPNEEANTTVIVARPYVKYTIGSDEYIAYGKQIARSANQVNATAWSIDSDSVND